MFYRQSLYIPRLCDIGKGIIFQGSIAQCPIAQGSIVQGSIRQDYLGRVSMGQGYIA